MPAGRPRKPTATKRAQGNPGKRKLPKEPTPPAAPAGGVQPPDWTLEAWPEGGDAIRMWEHMRVILEPMGLLTTADADSLAIMCDAYAEYLDARRTVRAEGATYERITERGGVSIAAHPAVSIAADAWRRIERILSQFGMNPAARARIPGAPEQDDDEFGQFEGPVIADGRRAK